MDKREIEALEEIVMEGYFVLKERKNKDKVIEELSSFVASIAESSCLKARLGKSGECFNLPLHKKCTPCKATEVLRKTASLLEK